MEVGFEDKMEGGSLVRGKLDTNESWNSDIICLNGERGLNEIEELLTRKEV